MAGLHIKNKVRCVVCGRIHKITRKHLAFQFTEKIRERDQFFVGCGATFVFFLSVLAVVPIASKAGGLLLSTGSLSFLGLSAVWSSFLIYILCYGTGVTVGLFLAGMMFVIRKKTQDLGILGAAMTIFGGFGRMAFYVLGNQVGIPFCKTFPYELVLCGTIGTTQSIWRARLFPHR